MYQNNPQQTYRTQPGNVCRRPQQRPIINPWPQQQQGRQPPQYAPYNAAGGRNPPGQYQQHQGKQQLDYDKFMTTLNPKIETGVMEFLQQNPTADGRGVVIAILDTGVDPGADGLRITSEGKVKVIERYDCSGAGDVDTSTVVKTSDNSLTTLSGRTFRIPANWSNPSGEYHLGLKPNFHLYPQEVVKRTRKERRESQWIPKHQLAVAAASRELDDYYGMMSSRSGANESTKSLSNALSIHLHMTLEEKFMKEEIIAKVEVLIQLDKLQSLEDCGPYLDVITFKTSNDLWQTCLVSSDVQSLEQAILLHEYTIHHEFSPLSNSDRFNVSVNIWDEGNVVEIVGMCDPHGTHVASIASAFYPHQPELNGCAPGAQIISCTIGDQRLDAQETGTSYGRAIARICSLNACNPIHVINTSFGEPTVYPPGGKLAKLMRDVVDKGGVIWVSASGNDGPALSTADSPASIFEDCIIGVAAYISSTMEVAHSLLRTAGEGLTYTWCSRGPAKNGAMGINICAPGGAITSVPNYTLKACTKMNGSSMATPHATGCIALILSLALQRGIDWTPYSVKKSLEETAARPEIVEPFSQGFGLVQVPQAYAMVEYLSETIDKFVRFKITCTGGIPGDEMSGIYIRDSVLDSSKDFIVEVLPVFYKNDEIDPSIKIMYKQHLTLRTDAKWLDIPQLFELHNEKHIFKVRVNPDGLPVGVFYGRIDAYDTKRMEKGSLFSVDVTYINPIPIIYSPEDFKPRVDLGMQSYGQGQIKRFFIEAPVGSNWAVLRLRTITSRTTRHPVPVQSFVVQTVSLTPGHTYKHVQEWMKININLNEEIKIPFGVIEGKVLEIAISLWWPEGGDADPINMTGSVKFRGIKIAQAPLISGSIYDVTTRVDIFNLISSEKIVPSAKLTHQVQLLKPIEMTLTTLNGQREEIPSLKRFIYELQIMYNFTLETCTEIEIDCPMLSRLLYESDYISQLWMLFDSRKKYIASGDYDPKKWHHEIPEGEYHLKLQVRHENINALHRFMLPPESSGRPRSISKCKMNGTRSYSCGSGGQGLPLLSVLLKMRLDSPITLYCATNLYDAVQYNECTDEGADDEHRNCPHSSNFPLTLRKNEFMTCYIKTTIDENVMKHFPGTSTNYLEGQFTITDHQIGKQHCKSKLKVYFPQTNESSASAHGSGGGTGSGDPNLDVEAEEKNKIPLHINEADLLIDITKLDTNLSNLNKLDLSIEYMMVHKYFALAVKLLLHRKKTHHDAWNKQCDLKLKTCFEQLGWTHCIYFLDSNIVIQNPEKFRLF